MKSKTAALTAGFLTLFLLATASFAQDTGNPLPQGASIPGLGGIRSGLDGPGYLEFGGGYSDMYPRPYVPWREGYVRIVASGGRNSLSGEASRLNRYGDNGWYYGAGIVRDFSENWFADAHVGSSAGGFFLPKYRADASVSRKLLSNKQLVITGVFGYDKSKQVNRDYRYGGAFTYYTHWAIVAQGGVNFTKAMPGNLLDMSEYLAITHGHEKERYITLRAETGREGYLVVGPQSVLQDFDYRQYSATWRQWIGVNWGINVIFNHENTPFFRRNGGTVGMFVDF